MWVALRMSGGVHPDLLEQCPKPIRLPHSSSRFSGSFHHVRKAHGRSPTLTHGIQQPNASMVLPGVRCTLQKGLQGGTAGRCRNQACSRGSAACPSTDKVASFGVLASHGNLITRPHKKSCGGQSAARPRGKSHSHHSEMNHPNAEQCVGSGHTCLRFMRVNRTNSTVAVTPTNTETWMGYEM